jgi:hypothetical protein
MLKGRYSHPWRPRRAQVSSVGPLPQAAGTGVHYPRILDGQTPRHELARSRCLRNRHAPLCLFSPKGAQSLSPGHRPGYRAYPRLSALKGRHTWRALPVDCRYAAPVGLNLVDDSIPRAVPWADELPRLPRSRGVWHSRHVPPEVPPRVKGPVLLAGRGDDRKRTPYGADLRPGGRGHAPRARRGA